MARSAYEADSAIEADLFGEDVDCSLYSAAQITDLLAHDFEQLADEHADFYLGE